MELPSAPSIKTVEVLMTKSLTLYHRKKYKEAKQIFTQALTTARTIKPLPHLLIARAVGNLANTSKELQEYARAVELYEEALQIFSELQDKKREGIILFNAALTYKIMRKWKDVVRLMEKRLTLGDELTKDVVKKAQDLIVEGTTAIEKRRKDDEFIRLLNELRRATLLVQSRQNNEALLKLAVVYSEAERCNVKHIQANSLVQIARVHTRMGRVETALDELNRACALHRLNNTKNNSIDIQGEHTALGDLASLLIRTSRTDQALAVLSQKVELSTNETERIELVTRITQMRADLNSVGVVVPVSQFINSVGGNRSEGELQLQRAELDAKRERELMQLCFKDIPFPDVLTRADQAQQTLNQLIPLLRTHAESEDQLGKILLSSLKETNAAASFFGVSSSNTKAKFKEPGTLGKALDTIRNDIQLHSNEARALASKMQELVVSPLTRHKEQMKQATKRLSLLAIQSNIQKNKAHNALKNAKSSYQKLFESVEKTRKQLESVDVKQKDGLKKQTMLSNRLNKLVVQKADAREQVSRSIDNKEVADYSHSADIMSIADDYQRAELMRLDVVKEHARNMVQLEIEAVEKRRSRLMEVMEVIDSIDPTSDVRLYTHNRRVNEMLVQKKSTGKKKIGTGSNGSNGSNVGSIGGSSGGNSSNGSNSSNSSNSSNGGNSNGKEDEVHYASGHHLLKEIVMGLFQDAELHDTNFQKKVKQKKRVEPVVVVKEKEIVVAVEEKNVETKGDTEDKEVAQNNENKEDTKETLETTQATVTTETENEKEELIAPPLLIKSIDDIHTNMETYSSLFHHESNRAMFVKLLNLQRSKVQDVSIGYDALSTLMCNYLDCCQKQSDVRSAKMIMIMSETFYRNKKIIDGTNDDSSNGRTDTREYLQTHIRQHTIWQNPHFWEEAFFMSCREEVMKHMERATELATSDPVEFKRVYVNICFGQLGSYVLNACTFGFGIKNVHAFIEKMCSVNDLSQEQHQMLIENCNAVFKSAKGLSKRGSIVAPKFCDSPNNSRATSDSILSERDSGELEYM